MIEIFLLSVAIAGILALHGHVVWVRKEIASLVADSKNEIKSHLSSLVADFDEERTKLVADKAALQLKTGQPSATWDHENRKVVRK